LIGTYDIEVMRAAGGLAVDLGKVRFEDQFAQDESAIAGTAEF